MLTAVRFAVFKDCSWFSAENSGFEAAVGRVGGVYGRLDQPRRGVGPGHHHGYCDGRIAVGPRLAALAGRSAVGAWLGVLVTAVSGGLFGVGSALLTFVFMAVKTGLHAHGPEFTQAEIVWVWDVAPLWTAVWLLVGLGIGLIWAGSE